MEVVALGADSEEIDVQLAAGLSERGVVPLGLAGIGIADGSTAAVDLGFGAGLGVDQIEKSVVRQRQLATIRDVDEHQIVAVGAEAHGIFVPAILKVREGENDRATADVFVQPSESGREIGARRLRLKRKQVAIDASGVGPTLGRPNDFFDVIGKKQDADPVVVFACGGREESDDLEDGIAFAAGEAAELTGRGEIDDKVHTELALLGVAADVGFTGAGGDVPIHGSDVVAGLIGADFFGVNPGAFEGAPVLAGEKPGDGAAAGDLEMADLLIEVMLGGRIGRRGGVEFGKSEKVKHGRAVRAYGTSTVSRMREIMASASRFSASAR